MFSQKARHQDLLNYIEQFPRDGFIGMACGVGAILHTSNEPTPFAIQRRFAHEFEPVVPFMGKIIDILDTEPDSILVHDEQLAVLIKYALLHANAANWPAGEAAQLLIRLMLVYNSLHGREHEPKPGDFDALIQFELRAVFNLDEHLGHVIRRYAAFFEWARTSPEAQASANRLDLDADFQRFYGVTYEEWAAAAFCILAYFRQITSAKAMELIKPVMAVEAYLASITADAAIRTWLKWNTISVKEATDYFRRADERHSYAGMTLLPFMRRPLLELAPGFVCAPYLPYLENSLGSGLFFAFLDGYNEQDGRQASDRFTRFFGEFFEDYVVDRFRRDHPATDHVFSEIEYDKGKKSADLAMFEADNALFIDVTSSRFNVAKTLIDLKPEAIIADMEKIVLANAEQLDKSIKAFKDGRLRYPGIDPSAIKRIFPIVLSIQPLPRAFAFNRRILAEITNRGLLVGLERIEILTAEDAEMVGSLYKKDVLLSDILARKLAHHHPKAQNDSLKNYLFYFEPNLVRTNAPSDYDQTRDPWFQEVLALVKQWMKPTAAVM
jgi:hypothetical protein